jgi:hypothetical protein
MRLAIFVDGSKTAEKLEPTSDNFCSRIRMLSKSKVRGIRLEEFVADDARQIEAGRILPRNSPS